LRILVLAAALAAALALPAPQPAIAALASPYATLDEHPVAPGVRYERGSASAINGHMAVNLIEIDPATEGILLESSNAFDKVNAREEPTLQAARISRDGHRVVATINGSTFSSWPSPPYAARGLNITNGELITAGHPRHGEALTSFGIDADGRPIIGAPRVELSVTLADGTVVPISRFNQPRRPDESTIYTPRFDASTLTDGSGVEIVLGGIETAMRLGGAYQGTVLEVRQGMGDTSLDGVVVISAHGLASEPYAGVEPGDEVTVRLDTDPGWAAVVQAVGARELLLRNGQVDVFPTDGATFHEGEPRSAIGITAAGKVLMVAVDGRQPHSGGATMPEMAELMLSLGAVDAVNIDGGGSTVLAVRKPGQVDQQIVNVPATNGVQRVVVNALHVVSTIPAGPLADVVLAPSTSDLEVSQSVQFSLSGHDAAYNGVEPALGPVEWSVSTPGASIDEGGLLTALTADELTVTARAGAWVAEASVRIHGNRGPTVPAGLTAIARDGHLIELSWQASYSSNSGPIHYRLFRDGVAIGKRQLGLSYWDQRSKSRTFQYQVRAIDALGIQSELSVPVTITSVLHGDGPGTTDTDLPSVPAGLTATAHDGYVVQLSWQPSISGVAGPIRYRVFRNGKAIGTKQTALTLTDKRRRARTFQYQVRAIDAAGRRSPLSAPVTVTTVRRVVGG
jgi:hypothetical protein